MPPSKSQPWTLRHGAPPSLLIRVARAPSHGRPRRRGTRTDRAIVKKHHGLAGSEATVRWRISLLKGTPAKFLGYVEAPNEKAAIEAAAKEYKIAEALQDRLVARRDG